LPSLDLGYAIPLFLLLLLSLSVHEAAHAWTADRLGDPTARMLGRITLNPMAHIDWIGTVLFPLLALLSNLPLIGWAKPVPVNFQNLKAPHRDFAIVAAAGPASNLILATLGAAVFGLAGASLSAGALDLLASFILLNAVLAVFNMIPVPPLDGGNVAVGLLPRELARVIDQLRPWGFLILYALLFTGALSRYVFPVARSVAVFLISLF
jgi:Zn-dependent protease